MAVELQFLSCTQCQATGSTSQGACPQCRGLGLVAWDGEHYIYWGREMSRRRVAAERLTRQLQAGLTVVAMSISACGLGALAWLLYSSGPAANLVLLLRAKSPLLALFWLGVGSGAFVMYQLARQSERVKTIPPSARAVSPVQAQSLDWTTVFGGTTSRMLAVAEYVSVEGQAAIDQSWESAAKFRHLQVSPIHLLIGLLHYQQAGVLFTRLGISSDALRDALSRVLEHEPASAGQPPVLSSRVQEILLQSYHRARELRRTHVGLVELLEALGEQPNEVHELLFDLGVDDTVFRNSIAWIRIRRQQVERYRRYQARARLRPRNALDRAMTAVETPLLNAYSRDLTWLAQAGYLAPCIGRDKEIEQVFRTLTAGPRRNVLLVGVSGVGRRTIIEGIAERMAGEDVPAFLRDKRLVSLDVPRLVSGVSASEAQQRLLYIADEIRRSKNIVLAIPNVHSMVGITSGAAGSIDVAGVVAQSLQQRGILCLATTTPQEYRRLIEGQSSLDTVFERQEIQEVSADEAIQILEAKVGAIEYQQHVFFSYGALAAAVEHSVRYLHDRPLPENAIQVLQETATQVAATRGKNAMIIEADVSALVAAKTNIPIGQVSEAESDVLLHLEDRIHQRLVNQEEAVQMVAASLRRARAEMRSRKRPIATLLFLGPTGVGKTELAKTVADVYFGSDERMIRLDMSEYQEPASINRLIGAPPGYGSGEGGQLTEAVRRRPFSLILLDELEKAHPDILNVFLQVLDDGRLTDSSGRTVDFTNAIIIATSNAGTRNIQELTAQGKSAEEIKTFLLDQELYHYFKPEFLNRFDGVIIFKPLTLDHVQEITRLALRAISADFEQRGMSFAATEEAVIELAQAGFDPQFGARSLRRIVQQRVQDELAKLMLSGQLKRRSQITLGSGGKLTVTNPSA